MTNTELHERARELLAAQYDHYMPSSGLGAEVREGVRDDMPEMTVLVQLIERRDELEAQWDEETAWDKVVAACGGLDQFDSLADQWMARDAIKRMVRASTSVFAKWANDELMTRYHAGIEAIVHQAFVEGAAVGARTALSGRS